MTKIVGNSVSEVLGWRPTADKSQVLVGLKQPDGNEFALAFPEAALTDVIASLAQSTEAFPAPKGLADQNMLVLETNWYDLGQDADSSNVVLHLRLADGGRLAFRMHRQMAERLSEALNLLVTGAAPPIPNNVVRN